MPPVAFNVAIGVFVTVDSLYNSLYREELAGAKAILATVCLIVPVPGPVQVMNPVDKTQGAVTVQLEPPVAKVVLVSASAEFKLVGLSTINPPPTVAGPVTTKGPLIVPPVAPSIVRGLFPDFSSARTDVAINIKNKIIIFFIVPL
jgi:hypothetical protein